MIIQFGENKQEVIPTWYNENNVFVSRPFFKIVGDNGAGVYLLNSYKFRFLPKIYFQYHLSFIETGIDFAGWTLEFMWNKKVTKKEEV
jgi:hypothetical protein